MSCHKGGIHLNSCGAWKEDICEMWLNYSQPKIGHLYDDPQSILYISKCFIKI